MSSELSTQEQENFSANASSHPVPTSGEIRAALAKILRSDPFVRSERIKKLLEFLVESVLAGQQDLLKESLIGIEVFERLPAYDSKQDPVVRVEMRRLRSKLSEYYLHEGSAEEVRIWLEKGSYIPNLSKRAPHVPVPVHPTVSLSADINLKI